MANLYDIAYDLEKGIRESNEYKELKQSHEAVENDESAKRLFDSFREIQLSLQEKQMSGQDITEEEAQQAQQQLQLVQQHEAVRTLMEKEQHMSTVIADLNKIITKPLEDIYGTPEQEQ